MLLVGGLMCLMLLVVGVGVWYVASSMMPKVTTEPAKVIAAGKEILEFDIPDGFKPTTAISIDNMAITMKAVRFHQNEGDGHLTVAMFQLKMKAGKFKENTDLNLHQKAEKSLKMRIGKCETKEILVRGKKTPFRFCEAEHEETKDSYRVVEGEIPTEGLTKLLRYSIREGWYDDDAVVQMIESIR